MMNAGMAAVSRIRLSTRFSRAWDSRGAEGALGVRWERETIGELMIENETNGKIVIRTLTKIMKAKEEEEFRREEMNEWWNGWMNEWTDEWMG